MGSHFVESWWAACEPWILSQPRKNVRRPLFHVSGSIPRGTKQVDNCLHLVGRLTGYDWPRLPRGGGGRLRTSLGDWPVLLSFHWFPCSRYRHAGQRRTAFGSFEISDAVGQRRGTVTWRSILGFLWTVLLGLGSGGGGAGRGIPTTTARSTCRDGDWFCRLGNPAGPAWIG